MCLFENSVGSISREEETDYVVVVYSLRGACVLVAALYIHSASAANQCTAICGTRPCCVVQTILSMMCCVAEIVENTKLLLVLYSLLQGNQEAAARCCCPVAVLLPIPLLAASHPTSSCFPSHFFPSHSQLLPIPLLTASYPTYSCFP